MEDRLGATSSALEWLGKQLDTLKNQLEQSELALHQFSEQHSNLAVSLEDQQNIVAANIDQLSRALTSTKTRRIEAEARLGELKAALRDDPSDVHTSTILANPTIGQLRERYRTLVTEREALSVQYGEAHPKIVSINAQIGTVREAMRKAIGAMVSAAQSDLNEIQKIEKGEQGALGGANKVGLELNLQEITFRRLQRERDNTAKLYGTLLERTAQTDLTRALQVSYVRLVDQALVPNSSVSPRVRLSLSVGMLLGLLLGIAIAITLEQLDRVIRTVEDAEALGLTVLGVVPRIEEGGHASGPAYARRRRSNVAEVVRNRDLVVHSHPKSSVAECCRTIRTNLSFMGAEHPIRTLVVTSASPREGKTTVALSLAISFAQSGKRVLVVDTDLRKPRTHKALGLPNARGVTTILVGEHNSKDVIQATEVPGLDVLTSGPIPPNPAELLHTEQFHDLLADLRRRYDHVIFDSPPLAAVTDAAIVGPQMDGVLLVVHGQKTTREALRSALRQLRDVKAHVVGGLLNDVDLSSRHYGYGSYYYYHGEGYYQSDDDKPRRADAPAAEA
jgi:capsular exopolysaccharide synthesis family protein